MAAFPDGMLRNVLYCNNASATWTKPAGLKFVIVEVVGALGGYGVVIVHQYF